MKKTLSDTQGPVSLSTLFIIKVAIKIPNEFKISSESACGEFMEMALEINRIKFIYRHGETWRSFIKSHGSVAMKLCTLDALLFLRGDGEVGLDNLKI